MVEEVNAWEESCDLAPTLVGLSGEEIVKRAKEHYPPVDPAQPVSYWCHKDEKHTEFNIGAFKQGLIDARCLYHMSRPFYIATTIENRLRELRGVKPCKACGLTVEEGCSH